LSTIKQIQRYKATPKAYLQIQSTNNIVNYNKKEDMT